MCPHSSRGTYPGQANLNGFSVFAYDLSGRLNSENLHWRADANTAYDVSSGYSFDAVNNVQAGANGWTVNSSNQVTSALTVAGSSGLSGATGLSYDVAGNTHALNGGTLGYNIWGDLNSLSLPGNVSVSYGYDSSGRRLSKTAGTVTTYYLYEGDALLAELNSSGSITRQYTWGATGLVSDRSIVGASTQTRLYVFDGLGNTRVVVDGSNGSVLWQGAWTAWGQPNCASVPPSPFGYHGQTGAYLDSESGLLKMGARYYAPCLGRFLTRDPSSGEVMDAVRFSQSVRKEKNMLFVTLMPKAAQVVVYRVMGVLFLLPGFSLIVQGYPVAAGVVFLAALGILAASVPLAKRAREEEEQQTAQQKADQLASSQTGTPPLPDRGNKRPR